jgi:hypothetical protein
MCKAPEVRTDMESCLLWLKWSERGGQWAEVTCYGINPGRWWPLRSHPILLTQSSLIFPLCE